MLRVTIDPPLFNRFPALRVCGFAVADLDRATASITEADLHDALAAAAAGLARSGITSGNAAAVPVIQEWRQAFAACGLAPSTYYGSVESHVRRVLRDDGTVTAVPAITLSRAISARHLAPLSGYDVDALPGSIVTIRAARPQSDWFVPLGARPNDIPSNPAVVVYAAGQTVLSWGFNHRDSRQTSLRAETRRGVFFSEAIAPAQAIAADRALQDFRDALRQRGATVGPPVVADARTPSASMRLR
jgi:DNA/RNA-binding domain of Phe-tRNA-synthetase-like protein